jgi:hypothetical protein
MWLFDFLVGSLMKYSVEKDVKKDKPIMEELNKQKDEPGLSRSEKEAILRKVLQKRRLTKKE